MKRSTLGFVSLTLFFGILSCQTPSNENQNGSIGDVADTSNPDVSTDVDVSNTDSRSGSDDSGQSDTTGDSSLFADTSAWRNDESCDGLVTYPDVDETFQIPDRPPLSADAIQTGSEYAAESPDDAIRWSLIPNESLNPGASRGYDLYSTGGDAKFHLYISNPQNPDARSTYRTNLTVLVDYEPVDATIVHWDDSREEKITEKVGSGINEPVDSEVDIFDITIPESHFTEDRMYEVSIAFEATTPEYGPFGYSQRFALYRNGYERASRPCSVASINESLDGTERQLFGRLGSNNAILFTDDFEDYGDVDVMQTVSPGETKRFYTSFISFVTPEGDNVFYVPTLNGEPVDPGWYIELPPRDLPQRAFIDGRRSFEVTFPEEPGVYEVQVASWVDPFELWKTRDGAEVDGVRESANRVHSNAIRVRVVEESE